METDSAITRPVIDIVQPAAGQYSKRLAVFALVGLFGVFLASVLFNPPEGAYFTICGFKNFTGLPCPGCGLTHSFCALAKGDLIGAFSFNLLGPPLFIILVLLWIRSGFVLVNGTAAVQRLDRTARRVNLVKAFLIGFAVYGVARIGFLLAYQPTAFQNSPLSKLIGPFIQ